MSTLDMIKLCEAWRFGEFVVLRDADFAAHQAMVIHAIKGHITLSDMCDITNSKIPSGEETIHDEYGWIITKDDPEDTVKIIYEEDNDTYAIRIGKPAIKIERRYA